VADLPLAATIAPTLGRVGGGTLPRAELPSVAVDLCPAPPGSAAALAARLRTGNPPVIARVAGGKCRLDLRTVFPHQDDTLVRLIRSALRTSD
jgi:L-seryl-tRNA(Ser) seleniumtransferase